MDPERGATKPSETDLVSAQAGTAGSTHSSGPAGSPNAQPLVHAFAGLHERRALHVLPLNLTPTLGSRRLKFTCIDASEHFVVLGTNAGSLYIYDRSPFKLRKLVTIDPQARAQDPVVFVRIKPDGRALLNDPSVHAMQAAATAQMTQHVQGDYFITAARAETACIVAVATTSNHIYIINPLLDQAASRITTDASASRSASGHHIAGGSAPSGSLPHPAGTGPGSTATSQSKPQHSGGTAAGSVVTSAASAASVQQCKVVASFADHAYPLTAICWDALGRRLYSGDLAGSIRVFHLVPPEVVATSDGSSLTPGSHSTAKSLSPQATSFPSRKSFPLVDLETSIIQLEHEKEVLAHSAEETKHTSQPEELSTTKSSLQAQEELLLASTLTRAAVIRVKNAFKLGLGVGKTFIFPSPQPAESSAASPASSTTSTASEGTSRIEPTYDTLLSHPVILTLGSKPRAALLGACFAKSETVGQPQQFQEGDSSTISTPTPIDGMSIKLLASRPGRRLWIADPVSAQVLATLRPGLPPPVYVHNLVNAGGFVQPETANVSPITGYLMPYPVPLDKKSSSPFARSALSALMQNVPAPPPLKLAASLAYERLIPFSNLVVSMTFPQGPLPPAISPPNLKPPPPLPSKLAKLQQSQQQLVQAIQAGDSDTTQKLALPPEAVYLSPTEVLHHNAIASLQITHATSSTAHAPGSPQGQPITPYTSSLVLLDAKRALVSDWIASLGYILDVAATGSSLYVLHIPAPPIAGATGSAPTAGAAYADLSVLELVSSQHLVDALLQEALLPYAVVSKKNSAASSSEVEENRPTMCALQWPPGQHPLERVVAILSSPDRCPPAIYPFIHGKSRNNQTIDISEASPEENSERLPVPVATGEASQADFVIASRTLKLLATALMKQLNYTQPTTQGSHVDPTLWTPARHAELARSVDALEQRFVHASVGYKLPDVEPLASPATTSESEEEYLQRSSEVVTAQQEQASTGEAEKPTVTVVTASPKVASVAPSPPPAPILEPPQAPSAPASPTLLPLTNVRKVGSPMKDSRAPAASSDTSLTKSRTEASPQMTTTSTTGPSTASAQTRAAPPPPPPPPPATQESPTSKSARPSPPQAAPAQSSKPVSASESGSQTTLSMKGVFAEPLLLEGVQGKVLAAQTTTTNKRSKRKSVALIGLPPIVESGDKTAMSAQQVQAGPGPSGLAPFPAPLPPSAPPPPPSQPPPPSPLLISKLATDSFIAQILKTKIETEPAPLDLDESQSQSGTAQGEATVVATAESALSTAPQQSETSVSTSAQGRSEAGHVCKTHDLASLHPSGNSTFTSWFGVCVLDESKNSVASLMRWVSVAEQVDASSRQLFKLASEATTGEVPTVATGAWSPVFGVVIEGLRTALLRGSLNAPSKAAIAHLLSTYTEIRKELKLSTAERDTSDSSLVQTLRDELVLFITAPGVKFRMIKTSSIVIAREKALAGDQLILSHLDLLDSTPPHASWSMLVGSARILAQAFLENLTRIMHLVFLILAAGAGLLNNHSEVTHLTAEQSWLVSSLRQVLDNGPAEAATGTGSVPEEVEMASELGKIFDCPLTIVDDTFTSICSMAIVFHPTLHSKLAPLLSLDAKDLPTASSELFIPPVNNGSQVSLCSYLELMLELNSLRQLVKTLSTQVISVPGLEGLFEEALSRAFAKSSLCQRIKEMYQALTTTPVPFHVWPECEFALTTLVSRIISDGLEENEVNSTLQKVRELVEHSGETGESTVLLLCSILLSCTKLYAPFTLSDSSRFKVCTALFLALARVGGVSQLSSSETPVLEIIRRSQTTADLASQPLVVAPLVSGVQLDQTATRTAKLFDQLCGRLLERIVQQAYFDGGGMLILPIAELATHLTKLSKFDLVLTLQHLCLQTGCILMEQVSSILPAREMHDTAGRLSFILDESRTSVTNSRLGQEILRSPLLAACFAGALRTRSAIESLAYIRRQWMLTQAGNANDSSTLMHREGSGECLSFEELDIMLWTTFFDTIRLQTLQTPSLCDDKSNQQTPSLELPESQLVDFMISTVSCTPKGGSVGPLLRFITHRYSRHMKSLSQVDSLLRAITRTHRVSKLAKQVKQTRESLMSRVKIAKYYQSQHTPSISSSRRTMTPGSLQSGLRSPQVTSTLPMFNFSSSASKQGTHSQIRLPKDVSDGLIAELKAYKTAMQSALTDVSNRLAEARSTHAAAASVATSSKATRAALSVVRRAVFDPTTLTLTAQERGLTEVESETSRQLNGHMESEPSSAHGLILDMKHSQCLGCCLPFDIHASTPLAAESTTRYAGFSATGDGREIASAAVVFSCGHMFHSACVPSSAAGPASDCPACTLLGVDTM